MADEINPLDKAAEAVVTPPVKESLRDVINKATDKTVEDIAANVKEEPPTAEEPKKETPKEVAKDGEADDEDFTPEQLKSVKSLLKGLTNKDPKIQIGTVKILANQLGMDLSEIETKKEVKEAKKDITALLKEGLGEFDFLGDKLGPVIEKILNDKIEENIKSIKEEQERVRLDAVKADIDTQVTSAFNEYENAAELKDDVEKLMDLYRASSKVTPKAYFKTLINIAANEKGIKLVPAGSTKTDTAERINRNRTDANSRLASERKAEVKEVSRIPSKMNLKESVLDAANKAAELLASKK